MVYFVLISSEKLDATAVMSLYCMQKTIEQTFDFAKKRCRTYSVTKPYRRDIPQPSIALVHGDGAPYHSETHFENQKENFRVACYTSAQGYALHKV